MSRGVCASPSDVTLRRLRRKALTSRSRPGSNPPVPLTLTNLSRRRLLLLAACGFFGQTLLAQDTGPSGPTPSGTTGASSSSGSHSSESTTNPFGTPSSPWPGSPSLVPSNPSAPSFRTGESNGIPGSEAGAGADQSGAAPGASSTFGAEQPGTGVSRNSLATFTVPGFYGRGSQQFVVGEERLARPHFRFHTNLSTGYDDNVFQTPTHGASQPAQLVPVLVSPAVPAHEELVTVPSGDSLVADEQVLTEIPGQKAKYRYDKVAAVPAAQRTASWVTRASGGWDMQFADRSNLFTWDFDLGDSYYWDRPGKKSDYNGTTSLVYLRKLSGRAQFTFSLNAAYQSQPDFSLPNQPTTNNVGSYLTSNAKADLSYRLTPRLSTVTSVSYNGLNYQESTQQKNDYRETTFGTELRYLWSPRLTLLGELRYTDGRHPDDSTQDTTTLFVLVGGEWTLSRRFSAALRVGNSHETYTGTSSKASSPYLEGNLDYRLAKGTTISWNARYGFENSGGANARTKIARTGMVLTQIFSPRLQGSLSLNLVHNATSTTSEETETTTDTTTAVSTATTTTAATDTTGTATPIPAPAPKPKATPAPKTKTVVVDTTVDTTDATLGFHYTVSRHWAVNLNYTYTMSIGPESTADYYRQQVFLGAEFQF